MQLWMSAADAVTLLEKRKRITAKRARKILIGAAQEQRIRAKASSQWEAVWINNQLVGDDRKFIDEENLVDGQFWSYGNACHEEKIPTVLPLHDSGDFENGRFRSYRSFFVGQLPLRWADLTSRYSYGEIAWLEREALDVMFEAQAVEQIASDPGAGNFARRLNSERRTRPGPAPRGEWEQVKAELVVLALSNPEAIRCAVDSSSNQDLLDLVMCTFQQLSDSGGDPDEIRSFVRQVRNAWSSHIQRGPAPID